MYTTHQFSPPKFDCFTPSVTPQNHPTPYSRLLLAVVSGDEESVRSILAEPDLEFSDNYSFLLSCAGHNINIFSLLSTEILISQLRELLEANVSAVNDKKDLRRMTFQEDDLSSCSVGDSDIYP